MHCFSNRLKILIAQVRQPTIATLLRQVFTETEPFQFRLAPCGSLLSASEHTLEPSEIAKPVNQRAPGCDEHSQNEVDQNFRHEVFA